MLGLQKPTEIIDSADAFRRRWLVGCHRDKIFPPAYPDEDRNAQRRHVFGRRRTTSGRPGAGPMPNPRFTRRSPPRLFPQRGERWLSFGTRSPAPASSASMRAKPSSSPRSMASDRYTSSSIMRGQYPHNGLSGHSLQSSTTCRLLGTRPPSAGCHEFGGESTFASAQPRHRTSIRIAFAPALRYLRGAGGAAASLKLEIRRFCWKISETPAARSSPRWSSTPRLMGKSASCAD